MSADKLAQTTAARSRGFRILLITVLLAIAWLLWSGLYKPLLLGLGALSCALTIYVLHRMGYFSNETFAFRYNYRLLGYWLWLGKEIVMSSIEVSRAVLAPRLRVHPRTVRLDVSQLDSVDQALLGNSITLTPGTLTLDVYEGSMVVHALTPEGAAALQQGEMQRRVLELGKR